MPSLAVAARHTGGFSPRSAPRRAVQLPQRPPRHPSPMSQAPVRVAVTGAAGNIGYNCEVHVGLGMTGTVIVLPAEVFADTFDDGTLNAWTLIVP